MGWIIIQLDLSEKYHTALQKLEKTREYDFDLILGESRLRPATFDSQYCKDYKVNYHGFIGEILVSGVVITNLRKFL